MNSAPRPRAQRRPSILPRRRLALALAGLLLATLLAVGLLPPVQARDSAPGGRTGNKPGRFPAVSSVEPTRAEPWPAVENIRAWAESQVKQQLPIPGLAADATAEQIFALAEKLHAEQSYRLASNAYTLLLAQLQAGDQLFHPALFGVLDTMWRGQPLPEQLPIIDRQLDRLAQDLEPANELRARAAESLGDLRAKCFYQLVPPPNQDDPDGLQYITGPWLMALADYAQAPQSPANTRHYVDLAFKVAEVCNQHRQPEGPYKPLAAARTLPGLELPAQADADALARWALRGVLRAAPADKDAQTRAHLMLGQLAVRAFSELRWRTAGPDTDDRARQNKLTQLTGEADEQFGAAVAAGGAEAATALWEHAQFLGGMREDYVAAVAKLRTLLEDNPPGTQPFLGAAREMLAQLATPQAALLVPEAFAPGSHLRFDLQTRNLKAARLRIVKLEPRTLAEARAGKLPLGATGDEQIDPLSRVLPGKEVYNAAIEGIVDDGKHTPHAQAIFLDPLPRGAYQVLLDAPAIADVRYRPQPSLLFVTQLAVAAREANEAGDDAGNARMLHVFATDAESGRALPDVELTLLATIDRNQQQWRETTGKTGEDGLTTLELPRAAQDVYGQQSWLLARRPGKEGDELVMLRGDIYSRSTPQKDQQQGQPNLVAWSDRPAYRPGEAVQFKGLLRYQRGLAWELPQLKEISVDVRDARDTVLYKQTLAISANGTFHGSFTPTATAALGMLTLTVHKQAEIDTLGSAQLARLEEYKLPEYKVGVEPVAGQHRVGEPVAFNITADYYAGGPVAGADVEVVIYRRPFARSWWPELPWSWFTLDDGNAYRGPRPLGGGLRGKGERFGGWWPGYQPEALLARKTLKTDARGRASVTLDAESSETLKALDENGQWGYAYRVEARVVDLSRREVVGQGQIKLARTAFAAYLTPRRNLVLPADPLRIDLKVLDPNDRPVAAEGQARLYRLTWNPQKPVLDSNGKPTGEVGDYDETLLETRPAGSDGEGNGLLEFTPGKAGVYLARFNAADAFGQSVTAEATAFVAESTTTDVGWRAGGVSIVTDKQRYKRGETAQVLLISRRPGAAIWFTTEADGAFEQRVVQLAPGASSQVLALPIDKRYEPNIYLTALAMFDASLFDESVALAVPPVDRALDVRLSTPKGDYRPGERAAIDVEVRDEAGQPVATELSLAVADDAVWAIQSELAPELRAFFWGRSRGMQRNLFATPQQFTIQQWRPLAGKPGEFELVGRDDGEAAQMEEDRFAGGAMKDKITLGGGMRMEREDKMAVSVGASSDESNWAFKAEAMPMAAAPAPLGPADAMGQAAPLQAARLRSDFSATALWLPMLETGADGRAHAEFTLPDSLTTWRATARAADATTRVGEARHTVTASQQVMLRPQHPRFLVEGDEAVLSAIVDNRSTQTLTGRASLGVQGSVALANDARATQSLTVAGGTQQRVEWPVVATRPLNDDGRGSAALTMQVQTPLESDAALKKIPVLEYGAEKYLTAADALTSTDTRGVLELALDLPAEIKPGSESLTVWLEPTLARSMVNALPYLAQYPYGCVEQTTSRFVPAVITLKTIQQLGLRRPQLEAEVPKMIKLGLERLASMQRADGAWGWWSGGEGDVWMTAYVLASLAEARTADVSVDAESLRRAAHWLAGKLVEQREQPAQVAFMLHALARVRDLLAQDAEARRQIDVAHAALWSERGKLNPYGRALFTLAAHLEGRTSETAILARNLYDGIEWDRANGTAHWGSTGYWYHWSEGGIEATAYGLRALLAIDPRHPLVEPVTQWLVRNRKGARWQSTRDTAIVIGALADVIRQRGEAKPNWTAAITVNGADAGQFRVEPATALDAEGRIEIPRALLRPGRNTIRIARDGTGALYAAAGLAFFTREQQIAPAMHELGITRRYFVLGQQMAADGQLKETRRELRAGDPLHGGERVEVELTLEAKNHYEYVMIEDPRAAGLEAVDVQSGYANLGDVWAYRELRDDKAAIFLDRVPQGKHVLRYTLRAETSGLFHALPSQAQAMYVPELRGNGASDRLRIEEPATPQAR